MSSPRSNQVTLVIGSFPDPRPDAQPEGLWLSQLNVETGVVNSPQLAIEAKAPTFITNHPTRPVIFAIHETEVGGLSVFDFSSVPHVSKVDTVPCGGVGPCHVSVDSTYARISHYGSGHIGAVPLSDEGRPDGPVESLAPMTTFGSMPQQGASHAHFAQRMSDDVVWSTDLGSDVVRAFGTHSVTDWDSVVAQFPDGSGPRHLTTLPAGNVIVVGEIDSHLYLLKPSDDHRSAELTDLGLSHRSLTSEVPSYPSHVEVSPDGKRLYVTTRGVDVLSVFAIHDSAAGVIEHLEDVELPEAWPRHFAVVEGGEHDVVIVAQERGHKLVSYRVNHADAAVELAGELDLPAPACVLPLREA